MHTCRTAIGERSEPIREKKKQLRVGHRPNREHKNENESATAGDIGNPTGDIEGERQRKRAKTKQILLRSGGGTHQTADSPAARCPHETGKPFHSPPPTIRNDSFAPRRAAPR